MSKSSFGNLSANKLEDETNSLSQLSNSQNHLKGQILSETKVQGDLQLHVKSTDLVELIKTMENPNQMASTAFLILYQAIKMDIFNGGGEGFDGCLGTRFGIPFASALEGF